MRPCAKILVTILVTGTLIASKDVNPSPSPESDLRTLKISENAEERYGKEYPVGDVVKQCHQYLVNGEVVGERLFYTNGRLADEKLFRNKKLHGFWRQFHKNGKPFSERPYRDGLPDGIFRFWDEKGRLLGESVLTNGNGVLLQFENRSLVSSREEIPYVEGKIHGKRKVWGHFDVTGPNGCNVTEYKNGEMDGWSYTLDGDGTLLAYTYIKQDQLHGISRRATRDAQIVDGYPHFWIAGKEVTEEQFRDAAKTDKILALTLTGKPDVEESDHLQKPTKQEGK